MSVRINDCERLNTRTGIQDLERRGRMLEGYHRPNLVNEVGLARPTSPSPLLIAWPRSRWLSV